VEKDVFRRSFSDLFVKINPNKKILIFSDCHHTDKFDQNRFLKFEKIIKSADVVVINGDFWADSHISFEHFVNSSWNKLFPLLKQKETYYIFGNHDMPLHADERIYNFCTKAAFRLKIQTGKLTLHIEHGHLLSSPLIKWMYKTFEHSPRLLHFVVFPISIFEDFASFLLTRFNIRVFQSVNNNYKRKRLSVSTKDEYFIMGHTHTPELDLTNRYVNTGFTHGKMFSYVEVYENKIKLLNI